MRYLGVDYGSKKIGLALSDESGAMGFPYSIVPNTPRLVDEVCTLIAREHVGAVVVGDSRNLDGSENVIAEDARVFGEQITARADLPVFFESEVFTSAEARRAPEPAGGWSALGGKDRKSRSPKQHRDVDASAAALILTSYLTRSARRHE
ncbi:MAG: Holliday junction resolvase RuvX [Candidatus Paceibacterota bacterium]|jgi:putative Holliday junction resolvase